jgi:hypothetical protein
MTKPTPQELQEPYCYEYSSVTASYCIREAAALRGWSTDELAWTAAIPSDYMASLMNGQEFVGEQLFDRIAYILDYTPREMLSLMYFTTPQSNF